MPAKYRDQAPRVVEEDDGVEQWWYGDLRGRNIGLNAAAGKSREYFNLDASRVRRDAARAASTCTSVCAT